MCHNVSNCHVVKFLLVSFVRINKLYILWSSMNLCIAATLQLWSSVHNFFLFFTNPYFYVTKVFWAYKPNEWCND